VVKTLRAWAGLLVRAGTQFFANHAQKHAAAISYYVLFSIVPLVIFVVGIAGLVLGEQHEVRQDIVDEVVEGMRFGEPEGREEVEDAVNGIKGTGGGVAGLVALIGFMWGASSMLGAVAVFLFWVYLVACITLFGAEVAAEYPRARGEQAGMPGLSEPLPKAAWSAARGLFVRNSRETGVADERGHEGPPADG